MSNRILLTHDLSDLSDQQYLVLKDRSVLEDEDEGVVEMESTELAERDKLALNKRQANHGRTQLDWDEQKQASLLSKYDDFAELEKSRVKRVELVVGASTVVPKRQRIDEGYSEYAQPDQPSRMTLGSNTFTQIKNSSNPFHASDELKFQSDYFTEPADFRKSKPSNKKKRKQVVEEEDEEVKVDPHASLPSQDEDLHAQLARLRYMKRQPAMDAEFVANQVIASRDAPMESKAQTVGLSVSQFVNRIAEKEMVSVDDSVPSASGREATAQSSSMVDAASDSTPSIEPLTHPPPLFSDVQLDIGLACALKLFQSRGDASEVHRADISLARKDEFGRAISDPKEAYKQLSWKFHGVKPGAKKMEKRMQKVENEIKTKVANTSQHSTVRAMAKTQAVDGKAFLVLSEK